MKVVFVGPSLHHNRLPATSSIVFRPPAFQGDVHDAVEQGACAIGIIDGFFESVPSVWHKEILHALSCGVRVCGASSMGALRAAECADFGMVGIGRIFEAYRDGTLIDDEAVALVHAPRELSYVPLTIPLVNVLWTVADWRDRNLVSPTEADVLLSVARSIYFKERTWKSVIEGSGFRSSRIDALATLAKSAAIDRKALDAMELVDLLEDLPEERAVPASWQFSHTDQFERFVVRRRKISV
jgi:hypothetical protein